MTSHVQQDTIACRVIVQQKLLKVDGHLREHMMPNFLSPLQIREVIVLIIITALADQSVHTKRNVQKEKLGNTRRLFIKATHAGLVIQADIVSKAI
jgi:hypothetical protein